MTRGSVKLQNSSIFYFLYGKTLGSEWHLNLPEATDTPCSADFTVIRASSALDPKMPLQVSPAGTSWVELRDHSLYLKWANCFEFLISPDGGIISGHSLGCEDERDLELLLLGPVISFALLKHGIEHIHATAVVVNGKAVAFMGDSTFGKSTLAASFLRAGYRLLTDDLLVVSLKEGRLWAHPGPQRIKVFPETARELLGTNSHLSSSSLTTKLQIPLNPDQFQSEAIPLGAVYILNCPGTKSGTKTTIRTASKRNACMHVLKNVYNTVSVNLERATASLDLASKIAKGAPVKTLSYVREYSTLTQVRDAILADLLRDESR